MIDNRRRAEAAEERVTELKEKYETPGVRCGRGHENILPVSLWTCPMCHQDLTEALEALVGIQAHYAGLLNAYDGGTRIQFKSGAEWLARFAKVTTVADDVVKR